MTQFQTVHKVAFIFAFYFIKNDNTAITHCKIYVSCVYKFKFKIQTFVVLKKWNVRNCDILRIGQIATALTF